MEENNINLNSSIISNKRKVPIENKTKLLLLRKIKLGKFPQLSKNLNDFFWNSEKYFEPRYKDHLIVVGNKQNYKTRSPITKRRVNKRQTRKMLIQSLHSSTDLKKKLIETKDDTSSSRTDKKRGISKNTKEGGLKNGQKYIDDFELEELFDMFKKVQKINKKKFNNFVMAREFIDNNTLILKTKTSTNLNKILETKKSQTIINKKESKNLPYLWGPEMAESQISSNKKNLYNLNNDYYKTASTFMSLNSFKEEKDDNKNITETNRTNNNNFSSISKIHFLNKEFNNYKINDKKAKTAKNFYHIRTLDENKKVLSRNNLIKKQNQFLLNNSKDNLTINKGQRTIYAKLLANQEQAIMQITKNQSKSKNLFKTLSEKTHRDKKDLLITNIESYRIKNELKDKFLILNSKLSPEHVYNWTNDLRRQPKSNKNNNNENDKDNNYDLYNIRDPFNKTMYNLKSKKNLSKKKDLKYFKNIIDESNNINNNLDGMFIKGENLLKKEYEQAKDLKNRKILNNFEMFLPPSDFEDILFTDQKYMNKKKIEEKNKNKISNIFFVKNI